MTGFTETRSKVAGRMRAKGGIIGEGIERERGEEKKETKAVGGFFIHSPVFNNRFQLVR